MTSLAVKAISVIPEWLFCLKAVEFFLGAFFMALLKSSWGGKTVKFNVVLKSQLITGEIAQLAPVTALAQCSRERSLYKRPGQCPDEGTVFSIISGSSGYSAKKWIVCRSCDVGLFLRFCIGVAIEELEEAWGLE